MQKLCVYHGIKLKHGSPYSPTTTGAIERFNQTLMNKIRKITKFGKKDWESAVKDAVKSYNISYNRTIGCAPHEVYEGPVWLDIDSQYFNDEIKLNSEKIDKKIVLRKLNTYRKTYEVSNSKVTRLEVGDKVWYKNPVAVRTKLSPMWTTKAEIIGKAFDSYT
jgi:transposase InsO family protein